jgi:hypothetical protein
MKDLMEPSLVVVGSDNPPPPSTLLHRMPDCRFRHPTWPCGRPTSSSTPAIPFTRKIAFANEIGTLSTALGLDGAEFIENVFQRHQA